MRAGRVRDRGSAAVELTLLTPLLMVFVLFVVHAGRAGSVYEQVRHAADQGARAASLVGSARRADAARQAVSADLRRNGAACTGPTVAVTEGLIGRVHSVRVTVSCTIDTTGLSLLGTTRRAVEAHSIEAIDVFRGGS